MNRPECRQPAQLKFPQQNGMGFSCCEHAQLSRTVSDGSSQTLSSSTASSSNYAGDSSSHQFPSTTRSRSRNTKQKRVYFSSTSNLHMLPPRSSLISKSLWYTQQDFTIFKRDLRYFANAMEDSPCADTFLSLARSLATKTAVRKHDVLQSNEKILARGIEHNLKPKLQGLIALHRKVVIRKVLREQSRLRQEQHELGLSKDEYEERMVECMAECSRSASVFAQDWAILKLLNDDQSSIH